MGDRVSDEALEEMAKENDAYLVREMAQELIRRRQEDAMHAAADELARVVKGCIAGSLPPCVRKPLRRWGVTKRALAKARGEKT